MQPLVSIVLLNYNGFEDTVDCIDSIKKNSYQNYEIVVVDNDSPDESGRMLSDKYVHDQKVHVILNGANAGFSGGNNVGVTYALENDVDYVMLLNNDTIVDSEFLTGIIPYIQESKEKAIYTGKILFYNEPNKIWCAGGNYNKFKGTVAHRGYNVIDNGEFDKEVEVDFICGCYALMPIEVLKVTGLWPEEYFLYCEDLAYSLIARSKGIRLIYLPKSKIYHKISSTTSKLSGISQYYNVRNRFYIIKKYHHGISKISAYLFSLLWCWKRVNNGMLDKDISKRALIDFKKGKMFKENARDIEN